jgi:hypothetical protein
MSGAVMAHQTLRICFHNMLDELVSAFLQLSSCVQGFSQEHYYLFYCGKCRRFDAVM